MQILAALSVRGDHMLRCTRVPIMARTVRAGALPWRFESPLPLGNYEADSDTSMLSAVAHEGRVVMYGAEGAPPLALVDGVWTELPHLAFAAGTARMACLASLPLRQFPRKRSRVRQVLSDFRITNHYLALPLALKTQ